ncbi:MAG: hypothetical protein WKG03_02055 [Telluria sp.]
MRALETVRKRTERPLGGAVGKIVRRCLAASLRKKYDTVWFAIEYAKTFNSNFVHVGNLSEGCVTMYELEKWNALYAYLISNRLDTEGKYVGSITIE